MIEFKPIGVIHTPFESSQDIPIQPVGGLSVLGTVDVYLDGTPLLDIKPYVPELDHRRADRVGWLEQAKGAIQSTRADDRFT